MGSSRFDATDWKKYTTASSYATKATHEIFTSRSLKPELDPAKIAMRESRDSDANPNSTALILALDVTGSMGVIADRLAREHLPKLVTEIYARKPISDPHILCMGIGDMEYDRAPVQATQFEADGVVLAKALESLYLEHGGGGNHYESYTAAWYFAAMKTSIDCFEKRKKKGYLITIGDEEPTPILVKDQIARFFGDTPQFGLSALEILAMVEKKYEVFHLMVEQGSHMRHNRAVVVDKWTELIGQRAILLSDYDKLSEVITSIIQVNEGANKEAVVASWNGDTSVAVRHAVGAMKAGGGLSTTSGVVTF